MSCDDQHVPWLLPPGSGRFLLSVPPVLSQAFEFLHKYRGFEKTLLCWLFWTRRCGPRTKAKCFHGEEVCPGSTDLGSSQLPHPEAAAPVGSYRSRNQCDWSEETAYDSGRLISWLLAVKARSLPLPHLAQVRELDI